MLTLRPAPRCFWFPLSALLTAAAADQKSELLAWNCASESWGQVYDAVYKTFFEDADADCDAQNIVCTTRMRILSFTVRHPAPFCPVGQSVLRLSSLLTGLERDWHADAEKVGVQPIALLHIPFSAEVRLLTDAEDSLPRGVGSGWFDVLFALLASLSERLCPNKDEKRHGRSGHYRGYCKKRPWTIGCDRPLPSCEDEHSWRANPGGCFNPDVDPSVTVACLRKSMPAEPRTLLELLVPRQKELWLAVKQVMAGSGAFSVSVARAPETWGARTREPVEDFCMSAHPVRGYMAASLCPSSDRKSWAPAQAKIVRTDVLRGQLEAIIFGANIRKLDSCGVEVEILLHVDEPSAAVEIDTNNCFGFACREQCAGWEAANYLRFECVAGKGTEDEVVVSAATFSGQFSEPALQTTIICRFPWHSSMPKWMRVEPKVHHSSLEPWIIELQEVDGVFKQIIDLRFCPYRREAAARRQGVLCLRPLEGAQQHRHLFNDWLRYHRVIGADHFFAYDGDGSLEAVLVDDAAAAGGRPTNITYLREWPRQLGVRTSALYDSFWKLMGGTGCVEVLQANHCLSLAKSAGFKWLVYIRGIDKFLHSDLDQGPGLLRRFFDLFSGDPGVLVRRRDCGGLDQSFADLSAAEEVTTPAPMLTPTSVHCGISDGSLKQASIQGSSSGSRDRALVIGSTGNYIKWILNVSTNDFHITSEFKAEKFEATGLAFVFWSGDAQMRVGLDGIGNTFFYEGGAWGDAVHIGPSSLTINRFQILSLTRKGSQLTVSLGGQHHFVDFPQSITAVGWRPWRNTIHVKSLCQAAIPAPMTSPKQALGWRPISLIAACEANDEAIMRTSGSLGFTKASCKAKCQSMDGCRAIDFFSATGWCNTYDSACKTPYRTMHGASSYSVEELPPVFGYFTQCEPLAGLGRRGDLSYVPAMQTDEVFLSMPTFPMMHNATQPRFIPVHVLRAQHFVKAFELGGTYGAQRLYERGWDRTAKARFTEAEHGLDWALPFLRSPGAHDQRERHRFVSTTQSGTMKTHIHF